jgi:Ankyrin repeats (3 copies)
MNRKYWGAALLVSSLAPAAAAQDNPAADAWRRLQLSSGQLVALYLEAAAVHNGFVYTVDLARFADCSQAQKISSDLDGRAGRLKPLRQVTKASRYANRFLFAMEPELREHVRAMTDGERTGVVKLANGECLVAEVVDYKQQPMLEPKELGPTLALIVDRGWLPHPDRLEKDEKLRNRTLANRIRTVADVEAAPEGFDVNTRRSDGYTILTWALLLNRADVARAVLKRGADPNLCGPRFCSIELAITLRDEQQARELLELLLRAGADANQFDRAQRTKLLPLAAAITKGRDVVERLIKAGAKPNGIPEASPPLFFAAASGKQETVEYLIAQGADLFARDGSRPGQPNTLYTAATATKNAVFIQWIEQRMLEAAVQSGKYKCELWLEQDGRRITAAGGEYRLKRAPFRIVVRLAEPNSGVMIASAETPAFQEDVRGSARESAIFRPVSTVAEDGEGKSDWLDVLPAGSATKDGALQYWFWKDDAERRFTGRRGLGRAVEYYKDVRAIALDQGSGQLKFQPVPLGEYGGEAVYLVAGVPLELSILDQRFVEPQLVKLTFGAAR